MDAVVGKSSVVILRIFRKARNSVGCVKRSLCTKVVGYKRGLGTPYSRTQNPVTMVIPVSFVRIVCQPTGLESELFALREGRCTYLEVYKPITSIEVGSMSWRCAVTVSVISTHLVHEHSKVILQ